MLTCNAHACLVNMAESTSSSSTREKSTVFEYYCDISWGDGVVEGKCKVCQAKIRGKYDVSSNFVTHLKVR